MVEEILACRGTHWWRPFGATPCEASRPPPEFRREGTWSYGQDAKAVSVDLWPNNSYISPSHDGAGENVFLITGGSGIPDAPHFYQGKAVGSETERRRGTSC